MRGAPQVGFSETIRKIRARTSLLTRFRPPTRLDLEIHAQYKRNPARCQFTTVRGVSKTREFLHPDQNILKATQNSLCRAVNRRRGRCVCKASSCRRRARFSRTRFSRERKELTIHPRRCRSDTIMARILSELSEFSLALSHSFCTCTTFWRDTGGLDAVQFGEVAVLGNLRLRFFWWHRGDPRPSPSHQQGDSEVRFGDSKPVSGPCGRLLVGRAVLTRNPAGESTGEFPGRLLA